MLVFQMLSWRITQISMKIFWGAMPIDHLCVFANSIINDLPKILAIT